MQTNHHAKMIALSDQADQASLSALFDGTGTTTDNQVIVPFKFYGDETPLSFSETPSSLLAMSAKLMTWPRI